MIESSLPLAKTVLSQPLNIGNTFKSVLSSWYCVNGTLKHPNTRESWLGWFHIKIFTNGNKSFRISQYHIHSLVRNSWSAINWFQMKVKPGVLSLVHNKTPSFFQGWFVGCRKGWFELDIPEKFSRYLPHSPHTSFTGKYLHVIQQFHVSLTYKTFIQSTVDAIEEMLMLSGNGMWKRWRNVSTKKMNYVWTNPWDTPQEPQIRRFFSL